MNTKKHSVQTILAVMIMLCIAASQWYFLATTGFYSPGASILCPMFAIFILHAGFFPAAWMKNEKDKNENLSVRNQLLALILVIFAFGVGFANLWLMRWVLK